MKGSRPLTNPEVKAIINHFNTVADPKHHIGCQDRNKAIFLLGISTGLRVGELSKLKNWDVYEHERVKPDIYLKGRDTKTRQSRSVPLNKDAQNAVKLAIKWQKETFGSFSLESPLFVSEIGSGLQTGGIDQMLRKVFNDCRIQGKVSTHSMRKTFATRLYEATNCLYTVKEILGHSSIDMTRRYIGMTYTKLHNAVNLINIYSPVKKDSLPIQNTSTVYG